MESHYNDMLVEMLDSQEDIKKKLNCLEKKFNSYEKKLTKLENGFDSQEKKLELEFTHILNYFKLCSSKIDDIEKVFRKSLSENNQIMFPTFMDINKNIFKMKYDAFKTVKNLISHYLYE